MFKKTLIAVALAGLSVNAMAHEVTGAAKAYTQEGAQSAAKFVAARANVALKAEYKIDDLITFTFSQPLVEGTTGPASLSMGGQDITAGGPGNFTLGLLSKSADGKSLTYRVTEMSLATTIDAVIKTPAVQLQAAPVLAANGASVSYGATLSNGTTILDPVSDSTKASAAVVTLSKQFTVAVDSNDKFNGVIDVAADRKKFELGATSDTVTLSLANSTAADGSATLGKTVLTLKGNFSFLKDTDPTTDGIKTTGVVATINAVPVAAANFTVYADKIVFDLPQALLDGTAKKNVVVTVGNVDGNVLPAQTFTADAEVQYTDLGADLAVGVDTDKDQKANVSGLAAGAWTLNGASVDVPYMPYGAGVEQFLWVTNKGDQAGDIVVTAFDQAGKAYGPIPLGTSNKGLVKLDAELKKALVAAGLDETKSPRVALNVTVNAKAANIKVYAAYKVVAADDRLTVPTVDLNVLPN